MRIAGSLALVLLCLATSAAADDQEAERYRQELAELEKGLPKVAAEPGRDTAPVQAPGWCAAVQVESARTPSGLGRAISYFQGSDSVVEAARQTCHFAKEPAVHKAAAVIEQRWINMAGLTHAEAVASLAARLDEERWKADKQTLCNALTISDEIRGEEKAFMFAKRKLFGCPKPGFADDEPMWIDSGQVVPDDLFEFLESSASPPDDLVRLALVTDRVRFIFREPDSYFEKYLVSNYVLHQLDYQLLNAAAVVKALDAAPYKGNSYARTIVTESLGRGRMGIAAIEAAVKKKTSDADWKELLVNAPQRGIAGWTKAADKWKDALARSADFEAKFWGPSRKALKGCWKPLRADFVAVMKTLKHATADEAKDSVSDPIASLLFSRLAACAAVDTDTDLALRLLSFVPDIRYSRGPRLAAYYASFDALTAILDDRSRFSITHQDLGTFRNRDFYEEASTWAYKEKKGMGFVGESGSGAVKAVRKGGSGVQITFASDKRQVMGRECTPTNRIVTFRHDGSPVYDQNCRDTGLRTVEFKPEPITVPTEWADNIKPGVVLEFDAAIGPAPDRLALPTAVYTDKKLNKLVNWMGFGL